MDIKCKTCDVGSMAKRKRYRLSGPAVVIGYLILIPSILGVFLGGLGIVTAGKSTTESLERTEARAQQYLDEANLPPHVMDAASAGGAIDERTLASLTDDQRMAISLAESTRVGGAAGSAIGGGLVGGMSFVFMVASFVGGLLGWLLTMKKKVLQCTECSTVVAAS